MAPKREDWTIIGQLKVLVSEHFTGVSAGVFSATYYLLDKVMGHEYANVLSENIIVEGDLYRILNPTTERQAEIMDLLFGS